jgi:phage gp36-like protein
LASRYLSGEEYVARYGTAETIRLTDEASLRVVDGPKLEEAIKDQTDLADGYIGTRYAIPLVTVPRVVKSIVAALTREALHKTKPTPEVTAAADRARTQLRDIAAGRMGLPIDVGGTVPVEGGNRSAITSGDGGGDTFKDKLASYGLDRGADVPAWRQ